VTIVQLRGRLLPSAATILLAACSNSQQPSPDATATPAAPSTEIASVLPVETTTAPAAGADTPLPSASPSATASPTSAAPLAKPIPVPAVVPEKIAVTLPPPAAWARCAVCHAAEKGAPAKIGPNLFGVYGHKMGQGSYAFSDALKASDLTLDDATLDKWLENPRALVPGNRMSFPGLKDPAKRAEIIAYLKQQR
jgi:cytochrome c